MESIWHKTELLRPRPILDGDLDVDCAVIGGGLAGVLTAWKLQRARIKTVVLEADRLGGGQTGGTTAKITAQHGPIYAQLLRQWGLERAGQYASANQRAVEDYRRMVRAEGIDCGFTDCAAYLFSQSQAAAMQAEVDAARRLGLDAHFTRSTELPFPVQGAARFDGQARFHPLKFLSALAEELTVYEHTRVLRVKGGRVETDHGTVRAKYVVFACHFPFPNLPGFYFLRLHQERSYVLALEGAANMQDYYLGTDPGGLSFRPQGEFLLLGGGNHRTGENRGDSYKTLEDAAARLYPGARVKARWSAQDCMSLDGVPYIGPFAPSEPDWYVATGFGKWGMTSSMAAANIIAGAITGRPDPDAGVFFPRRFRPGASAENLRVNGLVTVKSLAKSCLPRRETAGAFPTPPRCPHLGCQMEWNPDEETWDCPCHGSRMDREGRLLDGPAQKGIAEN